MIPWNDIDRPGKAAKNIGDFLYLHAIDCVVLERIARDDDKVGAVAGRYRDDPTRRLQPLVPHSLPDGTYVGGFHADLPVGRVNESNHDLPGKDGSGTNLMYARSQGNARRLVARG